MDLLKFLPITEPCFVKVAGMFEFALSFFSVAHAVVHSLCLRLTHFSAVSYSHRQVRSAVSLSAFAIVQTAYPAMRGIAGTAEKLTLSTETSEMTSLDHLRFAFHVKA